MIGRLRIAVWIAGGCLAAWLIGGTVYFGDVPIRPCGDAYCGKGGTRFAVEIYERFVVWDRLGVANALIFVFLLFWRWSVTRAAARREASANLPIRSGS